LHIWLARKIGKMAARDPAFAIASEPQADHSCYRTSLPVNLQIRRRFENRPMSSCYAVPAVPSQRQCLRG
jgi:hypothetical protein